MAKSRESFERNRLVVLRAEQLRQQHPGGAIAICRTVLAQYPSKEFETNLDSQEKTLALMAARILFTAQRSLVNHQHTGFQAIEQLKQVRATVETVYYSPQFRAAASTTKVDVAGSAYDFQNEMLRDQAWYCLSVFLLSGDAQLLDQALSYLQLVIDNCNEPTLQTLADFDYQLLKYKYSETSSPSENEYSSLRTSAKNAVAQHLKARNYERAMTVASRWEVGVLQKSRRSLQKISDVCTVVLKTGLRPLADMAHDTITSLGSTKPSVSNFVRANIVTAKMLYINGKNILQGVFERRQSQHWRKTLPDGFNVDDLRLSQRQ